MQSDHNNRILHDAIVATKRAGAVLKRRFEGVYTVRIKEDQSPVSEVDEEAQGAILSYLKKRYPRHSFFAEEGARERITSGSVWYIDPLDGTRNFIHKIPFFCVSTGYVLRGKAILGAIYDPVRRDLFWACRGKGAFLNEKPLGAVSSQPFEKMVIGTARPTSKEGRQFHSKVYAHFDVNSGGVRIMGSAALLLAYVAAGRISAGILLGVQPYDVAAGLAIAHEGGARAYTLKGKPASVKDPDLIVAHPKIAKEIIREFSSLV